MVAVELPTVKEPEGAPGRRVKRREGGGDDPLSAEPEQAE